jgi:hypothetical protein
VELSVQTSAEKSDILLQVKQTGDKNQHHMQKQVTTIHNLDTKVEISSA